MKPSISIPLFLLAMFCFITARADDAPVVTLPTVELTIQLTDNSRIIGSPIELAALPVKLEFTQLDIPLHLLAEAQFTANRAGFAVKFRNNDTLTGNLQLEQIKLKTSYGQATIPVARIAKITFAVSAVK